jgi:ubiquinone/menaquinone biosynthesis C-methylase UbiE
MPETTPDAELLANALEAAVATEPGEAPRAWAAASEVERRERRKRRRSNNPYLSRWARYYEFILTVPPLHQIRQSEERTLQRLLDATVEPTDTVLEIGPGTGRATVELASRAAHVTAVEQSTEMVAQLEKRLAHEAVENCSVILGDFTQVTFAEQFDVVALIGVVDYFADPAPFMAQVGRAARRAVVFTAPHCGVLAKGFRMCNRLRGVTVSNQSAAQVQSYLPEFEVEVHETGLRSPLWRGMTLACRAVRR